MRCTLCELRNNRQKGYWNNLENCVNLRNGVRIEAPPKFIPVGYLKSGASQILCNHAKQCKLSENIGGLTSAQQKDIIFSKRSSIHICNIYLFCENGHAAAADPYTAVILLPILKLCDIFSLILKVFLCRGKLG